VCRRFVTASFSHKKGQKCSGVVPTSHAEGRSSLLKKPSIDRMLSIAEKQALVRSRDFSRFGIHRQTLKRAVHRGLLVKIDRGLYACKDFAGDYQGRLMAACKRVPHGVVCLESALRFHRVLPRGSAPICMAIDRKARKPVINGLQLRFVRFSGQALTQGVVNMRIGGEPIRVYSVAKTVADCLTYRRKVGMNLAVEALREGILQGKCSLERLRHFAKIRGVEKLLRAAYSSTFNMPAEEDI
jgi:predicted transcriptional regulator of viral defense system